MSDFENDLSGLEDDLEETYEMVTLTDDNGNEVDYLIVDTRKHEGIEYLLLIDEKDADNETADAVIFKEVADENGELIFQALDDDEFDKIAALFEDDNDDYTLEV